MHEIIPGLWQFQEIGDRVNCYLWQWQEGLTIVDCGLPGDGATILAALQGAGFDGNRLKRILITHGDPDHMGGLYELHSTLPAPVACHTVEKQLLEHPERRKLPSTVVGRLAGMAMKLVQLVPRLRTQAVSPDQLLVDGQLLPEGFTVVHTPGHTPGHISLLHRERRFLIAGDALANRGGHLSGPMPFFTPDMFNAQRSIWKLAKKYGGDYDVAVFGHGPPITATAGMRIRDFAADLAEGDA